MQELLETYKKLINIDLPAKYNYPIRFNHCFNRVILDWLFQDCWYNHLDRRKTAISQLTNNQLQLAIKRMNEWLTDQSILIEDNDESLKFRGKLKK